MPEAVIEFHYQGAIDYKKLTNLELGKIVQNDYVVSEEMAKAIITRILGEHFSTQVLRIKGAIYFK